MASISLEAVTKVYPNGFEAVHGLDLEIADGELMVVVGPSGCGKTTVLRMIAGLELVTSGRCASAIASSTTSRPRDRDVAMVFQNYALYPQMNVADNIGFGLQMRKLPKREVKATGPRGGADVWGSARCSIAVPASSPAGSANASRWAARSCANRASS